MVLRFHLDESVSDAVHRGLKKRGIDSTTSSIANLVSAPDEAQLQYAIRENRVLVSHDDDFLVLASTGIDHNGIVYCRNQRGSTGRLVLALNTLWRSLTPDDMAGTIRFV